MHVLLIHQAFVGPNEAGGTRHHELACRMVAGGDDFTIVASNVSYLTGQMVGDCDTDNSAGSVRVLRAWTLPVLHRSYLWRVLSFLAFMVTSAWQSRTARRVDLVMGTSPPIFQAVSAFFVARLRRRPLLLEVRDLWPEFAIECGVLRWRPLIWCARRLARFLYAKANHILVNSPAYRDYLISLGILPDKISFIANGVDVRLFAESSGLPSIRTEHGLNDKFVVTYAGAMGMANDLETLIRAAEELRRDVGIHFVLVGDGKERPKLEEMCRRLDLLNVTFAGPRPKSEMPAVLAASDVCVATLRDIPMFRTTYPNKVFDYMAASRPTVLAIDGVIRDVIEAGDAGIAVPPGNSAALALAIRELASQRDRARTMGESARRYVSLHFDRDQQAVRLAKLCKRIVRRNAA